MSLNTSNDEENSTNAPSMGEHHNGLSLTNSLRADSICRQEGIATTLQLETFPIKEESNVKQIKYSKQLQLKSTKLIKIDTAELSTYGETLI